MFSFNIYKLTTDTPFCSQTADWKLRELIVCGTGLNILVPTVLITKQNIYYTFNTTVWFWREYIRIFFDLQKYTLQ